MRQVRPLTSALRRASIRFMDWNELPREDVPCPLCGSSRSRRLRIVRSYPVVKCAICGMVYLQQRPSEEALDLVYGDRYYDGGDVGYHGYVDTFRRYHDRFSRIFRSRSRDLRRYSRGDRVLEVGCAHGFLLDHLRRDGWRVMGFEVSRAGEYARNELGLPVTIAPSLERAGFAGGSFDTVLLLDVLEHLHRPFETLREIARLLAPGGILVVQCPWELYHWEEVLQAVLRGCRAGTIEPDAVPAHLYFFGPRTLDAFIGKGGFEIIARQSGNYGSIRRLVDPPEVLTGSPAEVLFRLLYFRLGMQRALYTVARALGLGSGLIRYAVPLSPGSSS